MPSLSKFFKGKDSSSANAKAQAANSAERTPQKDAWTDAWTRKSVQPEEVQELLASATQELKSRAIALQRIIWVSNSYEQLLTLSENHLALDTPFLILPFRPYADPNAAKTFIRNYFKTSSNPSTSAQMQASIGELKLIEPVVIGSIMKWCWGRLNGGVVTWATYDLFRVGEKESRMSRQAFDDFIPISVDSEARKKIIFDFFDLLASIAANAKNNGLGGRKLSRLAGWWAFEHSDGSDGFNGGYTSWAKAADATSHLFFAYLRARTLDPLSNRTGISQLPRSLEALVSQTEYPPETPTLLLSSAPKVVMVVERVSPTPFALLGRTRNFQYRENDKALQTFSSYEDTLQALTPECRRVLGCISSANQSPGKLLPELPSSSPTNSSWTRFEDLGFSSVLDGNAANKESSLPNLVGTKTPDALRTSMSSPNNDYGRPTTPSWADFMSSGFSDDPTNRGPPSLLLPPDQILPPIGGDINRASSSPSDGSHLRDENLDPGELANVNHIDVDETFWWVWMTSLANEEPASRKAVFGRCAFIETEIVGGRWLVIEEQVKGAAAPPLEGAYLAQTKRSRFTLSLKGRGRRQSIAKKETVPNGLSIKHNDAAQSSTTVASSEKQAKVSAVAAAIVNKKKNEDEESRFGSPVSRRARVGEVDASKMNSTMTLQPGIMKEAAPAMQWARKFDKETMRSKKLGEDMPTGPPSLGDATSSSEVPVAKSPVSPIQASTVQTDAAVPADDSLAATDRLPETPAKPRKAEANVAAISTPLQKDTETDEAFRGQVLPVTPVAPAGASEEPRIEDGSKVSSPISPNGKPKKRGDSVNSISPEDLHHTNRKPAPPSSPVLVKREKPVMEKAHPALRQNNKAASQASAGAAAAAAAAASRALSSRNANPEPAPRKQSNAKGGLKKLFGGRGKNDSEKTSESSKGPAVLTKNSGRLPLDRKTALLRGNKQGGLAGGEELTSIPYSATVESQNQPKMQEADLGGPGPTILASGEEVGGPERVNAQKQTTAGASDRSTMNIAELPDTSRRVESPELAISQASEQLEAQSGGLPAAVETGSTIAHQNNTTSAASMPVGQFQTRAAPLLFNDAVDGQEEADSEEAPQAVAQDDVPAIEAHHGPSEITEDGIPLTKEVSQDRWAQIKHNAERRASVGQEARPSSNRNEKFHLEREDDGDTSGEETIEERVARIKARVAELTGTGGSGPNSHTE